MIVLNDYFFVTTSEKYKMRTNITRMFVKKNAYFASIMKFVFSLHDVIFLNSCTKHFLTFFPLKLQKIHIVTADK